MKRAKPKENIREFHGYAIFSFEILIHRFLMGFKCKKQQIVGLLAWNEISPTGHETKSCDCIYVNKLNWFLHYATAKNTRIYLLMCNCSRLVYYSLRFLRVSKYSPSWQSISGCQTDAHAAKQNDCWFVSPVESVGDHVVVHKLPLPPKLDRDVELWEKGEGKEK